MTNNFFNQAAIAARLHASTDRHIREKHKDCPNFRVVHDEYICGPSCKVHQQMIEDAATAEELIPIDELEEFADKQRKR